MSHKQTTPEEVEEILTLLKFGVPQQRVAEKFGRSEETISRIYRNWLGDYRELLRDSKKLLNVFLGGGKDSFVRGLIERIDMFFEREEERKEAKNGK